MDASGEDVLESVTKIGGPESPLAGANGHAEHNLTSRHAPEAPILISVHSAWQFLTRRFLKKMPDLGVICPPAPLEGRIQTGSTN